MPIIVRKKKKRVTPNENYTDGGANDHSSNDDVYDEHHLQFKSPETIVTEVRHAISNLKRGVRKLLLSFSPTKNISSVDDTHNTRKVEKILLHIEHCMIHLQQHVNVLQIGLYCYIHKLLPHIYNTIVQHQSSSSSSSPLPTSYATTGTDRRTNHSQVTYVTNMIQHLFYWLLHLHDGYIYTISGECRHVYDQKHHRKQKQQQQPEQPPPVSSNCQKFPSQLNKVRKEDDDVQKSKSNSCRKYSSSKLYSPDNIYSGTSWDEFMDPTNGLRHRLLRTILQLQHPHRTPKPDEYEALWDTMIDDVSSPGYALELIVTHIEQQMQQVQMMFTTLTKSSGTAGDNALCHTIQKTLVQLQSHGMIAPSTTTTTTTLPTATLHWKDKMESLRITSSIFGTFVLERYGNTFQTMKGNESILPLHYTTVYQWWKQGGMEWIQPLPSSLTTGTQCVTDKKRRRVIRVNDDDDDDDDHHHDNNIEQENTTFAPATNLLPAATKKSSTHAGDNDAKTSSGLVVKTIVDCTKPQEMSKVRNSKESVNDIKAQFGVNIHDRENAFDIIQAEEAGATYDAEQIDHDEYIAGSTSLQVDDDYRNRTYESVELSKMTIDDEIQYTLQRLKRTKRTFIRLLKDASRLDLDTRDGELNSVDTNIWNAREVLREAYMSSGDILLWSVERRKEEEQTNKDAASSNCVKTLQKAIQYFIVAKDLVSQQQKLHKVMNPDPSSDMFTYSFFCRNLILLQIKAQVNIGIGYIQMGIHGHPSDRDPNRQVQFQTAVKECQIAYDMTIGMDHSSYLVQPDSEYSKDDEHIMRRDGLEALQLRALAVRWKVLALWYLHRKSEAFSTIVKEIVSSLEHHSLVKSIWIDTHTASNIASHKNEMTGIMDSLIDVYLENYYAWTMIADLASQSLERATAASVRESDKSKSFYDTLLDYVVTSISNAANLSRTLKQDLERSDLIGRYEELCECNRLLSTDDLMQTRSDIQEWWTRRLTMADALTTKRQADTNVERGELFSSAQPPVWENLPTQTLVLQPKTRRSKYNLGGQSGGDSTFVSDRHSKFGKHSEKSYNRKEKANSENIRRLKDRDTALATNPNRPFRRWREEMTYDAITDTYVPLLEYPSIAPPMPSRIQDILKMKSQ